MTKSSIQTLNQIENSQTLDGDSSIATSSDAQTLDTHNSEQQNLTAPLFYLVAGEASGDILGSGLIHELKKHYPNAQFRGIGGPLMKAEGLQIVYPMERLSVMGIMPIIARLFELLKQRRQLAKEIISQQVDCFIGIDAPVYNTELEYQLTAKGITCVHYVSPSVWAWRENRIHKIVKSVSLMICLFPFELAIYKKYQLPAVCVGHPLAEQIPLQLDKNQARQCLGLETDKKILAILPGSRGSEMKFLLKPFIDSAIELAKLYPDLVFVIPCANAKRRKQLETYLQTGQSQITIHLIDGRSREVMQAADVVLLASGTATLEAMLLKRPMLVAYKVSNFSFWIYRQLLKIKQFALPNLLAGKNLVKELMQDECEVVNIVTEIKRLLEKDYSEAMIHNFNQLHQDLRLGGNTKAAQSIVQLLQAASHAQS
ncbi:MAG: lipid-A-disaccharide synthase [Enterobacterales bacterium]|nr:lipid-A-disaccharide synthase [Enterobacterales bacterium]